MMWYLRHEREEAIENALMSLEELPGEGADALLVQVGVVQRVGELLQDPGVLRRRGLEGPSKHPVGTRSN